MDILPMLDPELKENLIRIFNKRDKKIIVGSPRSNWRVKVYPKPKVWVNRDTLKQIKK